VLRSGQLLHVQCLEVLVLWVPWWERSLGRILVNVYRGAPSADGWACAASWTAAACAARGPFLLPLERLIRNSSTIILLLPQGRGLYCAKAELILVLGMGQSSVKPSGLSLVRSSFKLTDLC
jgi:hypothetical protein